MRSLRTGVVVLLFATCSPVAGLACSCMAEKPVLEAVAAADVVFRGTVVTVEPAESPIRAAARRAWCTVKDWAGGANVDTCDILNHAGNVGDRIC